MTVKFITCGVYFGVSDYSRLLDKVDRCGSPSGLAVKLTVGANEVRHVGDMNPDFERSIR